jgi:hypothetical protein
VIEKIERPERPPQGRKPAHFKRKFKPRGKRK